MAREAGADEVVLSDDGWLDEVRGLTGGKGVELIFDPVGGKRFDDSVRALAVEGRLLVIGFAEGTIPQVAANRILLRNISIVGAAWGAFLAHHPEIIEQTQLALEQLIAAGHVKPIVGSSFSLEDGADALRELEQRRATGKIVISIAGD